MYYFADRVNLWDRKQDDGFLKDTWEKMDVTVVSDRLWKVRKVQQQDWELKEEKKKRIAWSKIGNI